jgi:hypothetical protein
VLFPFVFDRCEEGMLDEVQGAFFLCFRRCTLWIIVAFLTFRSVSQMVLKVKCAGFCLKILERRMP